MSAENLRRAAALMRERAQAATPGPWIQNGFEYDPDADAFTYDIAPTSDPVVSLLYASDKANAEHIASWHPVVALAVADLLEAAPCSCEPCSCCRAVVECLGCDDRDAALAVARAYLTETS